MPRVIAAPVLTRPLTSVAAQGALYVPGVTQSFTLACVPPKTSHHAKRIVRRGAVARLADTDSLVAAKVSLVALLRPFQPPVPMPGPISLTLTWTWPWLRVHGRKHRQHGRLVHTHKPDLSNVLKTFEDRLVQLRFIEDDAHVCVLHVEKYWGEVPGLAVTIHHVTFGRPLGEPYGPADSPRPSPSTVRPAPPTQPGPRGPEPELEPEA